MILGQTIRAPNNSSATYYGPWFPRRGTKAVFACNMIAASEVSSFDITVETKKMEDDNRAVSIEEVQGSPATISTATADAVVTFACGNAISGADGSSTFGFSELVRFKYVLTSNTSKKSWVHFRMLDPTWETD